MAELLEAGFIQDWVTTNYDGLAQKSGCLQVKMSRYFTFTTYKVLLYRRRKCWNLGFILTKINHIKTTALISIYYHLVK